MKNRPSLKHRPQEYREFGRLQCLAWAQGRPYHDRITDECTPDFSCCQPSLLEKDEAKRWAYYHEHYGQRN
jgi:hypothetical protein